jgi:hypothetical protein
VFDEVWQEVRDQFYDPGLRGLDWASVRAQARYAPQAAAADSEGPLAAVTNAMFAERHASHTELYTPEEPAFYRPAGILAGVLLPLLVAACAGRGIAMDQQARYGAMVGRSAAELTQSFGPPTRRENIEGHEFLIYEQSDVWPGRGGTGSRPAGLGRHGTGAVAFECRATFVVVAGVVSAYSLSGSGC